MRITMQRTGVRDHRTTVVRDDGVRLEVPAFDRAGVLPHDLAHYVVERSLGLRRAFWGTLADGGKYRGMGVLEGRQRPHAGARSKALVKATREQVMEAEVLVRGLLEIRRRNLTKRPPVALRFLKQSWTRPAVDAGELDADDVSRAVGALDRMARRWQGLAVGQSLQLDWPGPGRSPPTATARRTPRRGGR